MLSLCTDLKKAMSKLHSILEFIHGHKNWVVIIICALFVGVIDSNSIWERHYRWDSIKSLKREIAELEASYQENTRQLEELRNNPRRVERIAREKYFMTRPGEDLFIIQSDVKQPVGAVVTADAPADEDPEV